MPVLSTLRMKALDRVFGGGAGGFLAAATVGWLIDQAREAGRHEPERLDTVRLVPGESYIVTTRPAMSKPEAKLAARHAAASAKLAAATRPSSELKRVARKLSAAQRRAEKAPEGSSKRVRNDRKAARLDTRFTELTTPTAKQAQLQSSVDEMAVELERYRQLALASAPKHGRTRTTTFR